MYTQPGCDGNGFILSDVANYQIVAQDGVPFEIPQPNWQERVPVLFRWIWKQTFVKLNELLFDVTEYEPSDQVKQYNQKVQADTSQYMKKVKYGFCKVDVLLFRHFTRRNVFWR